MGTRSTRRQPRTEGRRRSAPLATARMTGAQRGVLGTRTQCLTAGADRADLSAFCGYLRENRVDDVLPFKFRLVSFCGMPGVSSWPPVGATKTPPLGSMCKRGSSAAPALSSLQPLLRTCAVQAGPVHAEVT